MTEGDATGVGYTVKLATQPSDTVTVNISGHDSADLTLSGTTLTNNQLTFTTTNWGTAQTVTVKAGDDDNTDDESETLAHTASGGDYVNITKDLPVSITDDGEAGVTFVPSKTGLTVREGDAAGSSYTVKLATLPSGSVSVSITGHAGTDLTLDKTTLTFTVDNWDVVQTVAVTAAEDDDAVTVAGVTLTHTVSGGGYGSTTVPNVEVSITEDDSADIVLSKTGLTVTEGDAAGTSYTVKLATQPSGSVSVSISGHDGTDLTLSGTTLTNNMLTFTVENWNVAQTVTVKAGQDDAAANDTGTLTHSASGGDYASVSNTLPVTVTDDDDDANDSATLTHTASGGTTPA